MILLHPFFFLFRSNLKRSRFSFSTLRKAALALLVFHHFDNRTGLDIQQYTMSLSLVRQIYLAKRVSDARRNNFT